MQDPQDQETIKNLFYGDGYVLLFSFVTSKNMNLDSKLKS